MAVASLVLGIVSVMCMGLLAGLPAIILGHMAHRRARHTPDQFSGEGMALAGFVMGYVSVLTTIAMLAIAAGLLLPALAKAKAQARAQAEMAGANWAGSREQAQSIKCINNMKNIGLAFRIYAADHQGLFPFNVATNGAKTTPPDPSSSVPTTIAKPDSVRIFQVLSNELSTPLIVCCPADESKTPAATFDNLGPDNVSYEVETGPEVRETNPETVLARCAVHGHIVLCDGSVQKAQ
jgi:hypothetical protein